MSVLEHKMTFTVYGHNMTEVEARAKELVDQYFGEYPHTYDITVWASTEALSRANPRWTATVRASKNR